MKTLLALSISTVAVALCAPIAAAQAPPPPPAAEEEAPSPAGAPPADAGRPPAPDGPNGFPGPRGPGGFGWTREKVKLLEKFDEDDDKVLNLEERKAAREFLAKEKAEGRGRRGPGFMGRRSGPGGPPRSGDQPPAAGKTDEVDGAPKLPPDGGPPTDRPGPPPGAPPFGGPFGPRENRPPPEPGVKLTSTDVKHFHAAPLYDTQTLRTLFLKFDAPDWEKELMDFHDTDVEVPARLTMDGKTYKDVGVHFRGMSSFMMVGEGHKHSLNLSLDLVHGKQNLRGYKTLNLLNSAGDSSLLRAVLYNQIAREYLPAPKGNWVRVVINGESWGVFVNVQQFNKDFIDEWFGTKKGDRWKAPGSPMGKSGLEYLGADAAEYKKRFELKSKDDPEAWDALIELCRVLNQTPPEQLEAELAPILNIDGALKFLALENVFINTDGYWTRASDFHLYRDEDGRFHLIPHDVNESFMLPEGPGVDREKTKGVKLDPLIGADDPRKPLLSKLLAVPALRTLYLGYVREIAETWLDWKRLGPIAERYQALLADDVKADTRKLASFEAFEKSLDQDSEEPGSRGPRHRLSLKGFAEQRRAYLLSYSEVAKPAAPPPPE